MVAAPLAEFAKVGRPGTQTEEGPQAGSSGSAMGRRQEGRAPRGRLEEGAQTDTRQGLTFWDRGDAQLWLADNVG